MCYLVPNRPPCYCAFIGLADKFGQFTALRMPNENKVFEVLPRQRYFHMSYSSLELLGSGRESIKAKVLLSLKLFKRLLGD